jgi:hypothetical protein
MTFEPWAQSGNTEVSLQTFWFSYLGVYGWSDAQAALASMKEPICTVIFGVSLSVIETRLSISLCRLRIPAVRDNCLDQSFSDFVIMRHPKIM